MRRDPYAVYARGRAEFPVHAHEGLPVVSIFRHADIQMVLRDPTTFSSDFPLPPGMTRRNDLPNSMLGQDPPEHTRLRSLVNQAFTPRMIRQLVPRMVEIAEDLVGRALAAGRVDLVQALTYPLPVIVIAEIIGVPAEDRARLKDWSDALIANLGIALFGGPSEERLARERRLIDEMRAYFVPLVDERRRTPREDLLSGLVAAELEGSKLTFDEMLQMVILHPRRRERDDHHAHRQRGDRAARASGAAGARARATGAAADRGRGGAAATRRPCSSIRDASRARWSSTAMRSSPTASSSRGSPRPTATTPSSSGPTSST